MPASDTQHTRNLHARRPAPGGHQRQQHDDNDEDDDDEYDEDYESEECESDDGGPEAEGENTEAHKRDVTVDPALEKKDATPH